jgi:hypothetical protein
MTVQYHKIKKRPIVFLRLFGIKTKDFENICAKLEPLWKEHVTKKYKKHGRNYKLSIEQMLLMLLIYYRTYSTQLQIGFMFGIDDSRVCRIIKTLEPLLAKIVAIKKNRQFKQEELALLIDVTEQPIERPSKSQKRYYSGKKKKHTLKTEIRVNPEGKICAVSKCHPGRVHDFRIHKESDPLPDKTKVYADSGYQGLKKRCKLAKTPFKGSKRKPLTARKKGYNKGVSRRRIKVENVLAQIKCFKILSERYRNRRIGHNLKFNVIAGIVNIKNGFYNSQIAA